MKLFLAIILAVIGTSYAAWSWKECRIEKGNVLLDNDDGIKECADYCPYIFDELEAKGSCKSYPSGYFCQCKHDGRTKDTQQSCKNVNISKVTDHSDGLETCEACCREAQKTNTGTCLTYITGWYCDCHD